ncbi:MAG: Ig-like domain-containing protein [Sandaracinaceae bacterium]
MRRLVVLSLSVSFLASLFLGCANDMPGPGPGPGPDANVIRIVGSPVVNLGYDEPTSLTVIYETADGEPIPDAVLTWAIDGDDGGARLGAREAVTDATGQTSMTLTSGMSDTMFGVDVVSSTESRARFEVSVSDEILGSITVSMTYAGTRTLVRFDTTLFQGQDCAGLDANAVPAGLRSAPAVSDIGARPAFAGLTPANDYTVAIVARNATHVAAFGCQDNIVVSDGDTPVNITLSDIDLPPNFVGEWDLDNRLDFGGALPPSTQGVLDVLAEIGDDDRVDSFGDPDFELTDMDGDGYAPEFGVDPGAFLTDIVIRQTCRWECLPGEDYDSCSEVNHPTGDLAGVYTENLASWSLAESRFATGLGGCAAWEIGVRPVQNLVNAEVARLVPDFIEAWAQLASDLARAVTNAHILSRLTITTAGAGNEFEVPITHELIDMIVDYENPNSDPPGAMETRTFALADAGFTSLMATEVSTVDGNTLTIPAHSFNIDFGQLTLYIYRNVLLDAIFGVTSTGDLLSTFVDCAAIGVSLEAIIDDISFGFGPSASTLEGYCNTALGTIGARLEDELAGRLMTDGVLTLQGTAMGADIDYDTGLVRRLDDGVWDGTFTEGGMTGDVDGTFTGVRASAE